MSPASRLPLLIAILLIFASPLAARDINLLPLGDSITMDGFYIAPLRNMLGENGYNAAIIANEGHSGYQISELNANITTYLNHPNVDSANTYILLLAGINDLSQQAMTTELATSRMHDLIANIVAIAPTSHLIVSKVMPANGYGRPAPVNLPTPMIDNRVIALNQALVSVVGGFSAESNVSLVDMYSPFTPESYAPYTATVSPYYCAAGNVHPNQAGGDLMAEVWYQGITTATPEPGGFILAATGLAALSGYALRKRNRRRLNTFETCHFDTHFAR